MNSSSLGDLRALLKDYTLPYLGKTFSQNGANLFSIEGDDNYVINVELAFPLPSDMLINSINDYLTSKNFASSVSISTTYKIESFGNTQLKPIDGVKNIIAISSGKGGVGKSTITQGIAHALSQLGTKVAILDADIYGPSQPTMSGTTDKKATSDDGKLINPINVNGIPMMSIGFLISQEQAVAWRGPMATSALLQLVNQTNWGELDYLIVDMPPGTGDIQLTLGQKIPVTGALIVTTPQEVALSDVRRGAEMFKKVSIPILGVIENMSTHICENCGHEEDIFGSHGGQELAESLKVKFFGKLPLSRGIQESLDRGDGSLFSDNKDLELIFKLMALELTAEIALLGKNAKTIFPEIRVEKM